MDIDGFDRRVADLCDEIDDTRICTEGKPGPVAERHDHFHREVRSIAAVADGRVDRERAGRVVAESAADDWRGIVEGLDAIVWVAGVGSGAYTFVSHHAEEILGYPAGRWVDDPGFWSEILHPGDREYVGANRRRCLEGHVVEFEYRAITAVGRTLWFRETIRLKPAAGGRPASLHGQMWDITRRKKVERRLYSAKQELARDLDDLSYLHEMSTRLSPMMEMSPLLDEILATVAAMQGAEIGLIRLASPTTGLLEVAASLGLSADYLARVDRLEPGSMACGIAASTGKPVFVEDTEVDPIYAEHRDLARLGGYRAAYSSPLIARDGRVLGTIATHFREPHRPPDRQVRLVEIYARLVADFVENAGVPRGPGRDPAR